MITLQDLKPTKGSTHRAKRLGQGIGSGNGKTSGKGNKGDKSRTGGGVRPGFEGGQLHYIEDYQREVSTTLDSLKSGRSSASLRLTLSLTLERKLTLRPCTMLG